MIIKNKKTTAETDDGLLKIIDSRDATGAASISTNETIPNITPKVV